MSDCPDERRLIEFALLPLQEENCEIAVHILHCEECARKLGLINQVLLAECEVSEEEWGKIRRFTPHAGNEDSGDLWKKIETLLTPFVPDRTEEPFDQRGLLAASSQRRFPCGDAENNAAEPTVDLIFEANCGTFSTLYWKASLQIVLSAGEETLLPITVTDGNGVPVSEGTLTLCGQVLPVLKGKTSITMGDFRDGLRKREVMFRFASGKHMNGSLVFTLEDVR